MDELLLLIQAHLDGELTDEQSQELQDRLRDDPAALGVFVQTHRIDQQLRACLPSEKTAVQIEELLATADGARKPRLSFAAISRAARSTTQFFTRPTPLSVTVAALVIGLLITALALTTVPIYQRWAGVDDEGPPVSREIVAELTDLHAAVWTVGQIGTHRGVQLAAGHRLELQEGVAEITYRSGAVVIVVAPAEFIVGKAPAESGNQQSPGGGTLHSGRAIVHVPEAARGFAIDTPQALLVDLGTRFGVEVNSEMKTDVHVLEGTVEAQLRRGNGGVVQRQVLSAGQAYRFASQSPPADIRLLAGRFSRDQVLEDLSPTDPYGQRAFQDTPVLYFRFQRARGVVENIANHGDVDRRAMFGRLTDFDEPPSWAAGPQPPEFPGFHPVSSAIDLHSVGRIEVADCELLRITQALTLEAWIQPSPATPGQRGIVAKYAGPSEQRAYDLLLERDGRRAQFVISADGTFSTAAVLTGKEPISTEKWSHVAATFEPAQRMRIYVNGRLDAELVDGVPDEIAANAAPLWIGCQFSPGDETSHFRGRIADVAVYDRALSADEIRQHFERAVQE